MYLLNILVTGILSMSIEIEIYEAEPPLSKITQKLLKENKLCNYLLLH